MGDFDDLVEPPALSGKPVDSFPGSRPPVNRGAKVSPIGAVSAGWDDRSIRKLVGGKEVEFFQLGNLALALGRKNVTIRQWEDTQKLPLTPFRSPPPRGQKGHLPGRAPRGRRLYTRGMVEGVLRIATEEGVILPRPDGKPGPPPTARFFQRVAALFEQECQVHTQPQPQQGHTPS